MLQTIAEWDKDHEFNFFPVGEQSWGGAIKDVSSTSTEKHRMIARVLRYIYLDLAGARVLPACVRLEG